jgi:hypothetical protein
MAEQVPPFVIDFPVTMCPAIEREHTLILLA